MKKTIILLLAMLPFFGMSQEMGLIDGVVAVVGKNIVTLSDIENQYIQYRLSGDMQGTPENMRCAIFEELMFQKLMLHQAELDSIEVTDDQVESEMERRLKYFISQIGSQEKLEEYYGKTIKEIKNEISRLVRDQMLTEQVQQKIIQNVAVTPAEVRAFFNQIPPDSVPTIDAEYEIAHIVKNPPISIDEKLKVKNRMIEFRKRILKGESFSTLAILYSEDPGSAKKGGELGFFGRGELAPEYEAAAFNLKEGEISDVVETQFGFHLIQLIERRGDYINTRHILLVPKVPVESLEKAYNTLDSVAQLIRTDSITFEKAAARFSDDKSKSVGGLLVNAATGSAAIEMSQLDKQLAFVVSRLKVGEVSNPIPMKDADNKDAYRIVTVRSVTKPHKANLTDDYARIQQWALADKRQKTMENWISAKSKRAYVKINEDLIDCDFKFNWTK